MYWHQELIWNHVTAVNESFFICAVILHIFFLLSFPFFFFFNLKGNRETLTQLQLSYFRVTLKLWLWLTNDLPVGIPFSAQNWPLKNTVIRHGGDFIGISLFIPVGCQASFCMNHLSKKNQWEAFECHFSWKLIEIPKLQKYIDVCPCVYGWVKWNCVWRMKNDKELWSSLRWGPRVAGKPPQKKKTFHQVVAL